MAQVARPGGPVTNAPASDSRATQLGRGYAALGAGRAQEAEGIARGLLTNRPWDHAAWLLHIEALAVVGPGRTAVDAYRSWLERYGTEDFGLLAAAAKGVLREIAASGESSDRMRALQVLAADGDAAASAAIDRLVKAAKPDDLVDLAESGNKEATSAVTAQLTDRTNSRSGQVLDQLTRRGVVVPANVIGQLLSDANPRTRSAAIRAAAAANAANLADRIEPLLRDPDSDVRGDAALALRRFGSTAGSALADELLNSDIPGVRLEALNVVADAPGVPVAALATPFLQNEDELIRVAAARLVARTQPAVAAPVLAEAAANENPAIADEAARSLAAVPELVIPSGAIVSLLMSPSATVRVEAGRAALEQARGH